MKYFTPERYLCLGDLSNEQAFLAAQDDWERAVTAYKERLESIRDGLPTSLRRLVDSVYLHDARVLDMWQGQGRRLTITLQPESDPSRLVVLAYSLTAPPQVEQAVLPAGVCSEPVAWLYDELDAEPSVVGEKGGTPTFTHNILLSNGWEVRLRFRSATVTRPVSIIPAAVGEGVGSITVPRSA
jgi:hypothetical protein